MPGDAAHVGAVHAGAARNLAVGGAVVGLERDTCSSSNATRTPLPSSEAVVASAIKTWVSLAAPSALGVPALRGSGDPKPAGRLLQPASDGTLRAAATNSPTMFDEDADTATTPQPREAA